MRTLTVIGLVFVVSACGSAKGINGGTGADTPQDNGTNDGANEGDDDDTQDVADDAGGTENYSLMVTTAKDLPKCVAETEGRLAYVADSKEFMACNKGKWAAVEVKGEKGEKGDSGDAGVDGDDGEDGTDNRIVSSIFCGGQVGSTVYYAQYNVAVMASGDVWASGRLSDPNHSSADSEFYSSEQSGSLTAMIGMTKDASGADNYGRWTIELDRTSLVTTVIYYDADLGGAGMTSYALEPEECIVNTFGN